MTNEPTLEEKKAMIEKCLGKILVMAVEENGAICFVFSKSAEKSVDAFKLCIPLSKDNAAR